MKVRNSFTFAVLAVSSALALTACGLGGPADLGDDRSSVADDNSDEPVDPAPTDPDPTCSATTALCIEGTTWSVSACACVPIEGGTPCGPSICAGGDVCCNESCGVCTAPGGACTMELCEPPPTDCSGIAALCIEGTTWSVSACACVPVEGGTPCGPSTCVGGDVCCNESCGICTPPGEGCTLQACGEEPPPGDCSGIAALCIEGMTWSVSSCACVPIEGGTPCGPSICVGGDVCCNESCGICTPPGGACTMQLCEPAGGDCVTDADCAIVDNYCGGCECLALPHTADPPTCADPMACFAAPCDGKSAACVNGRCTVTP